MEWRNGHDQDNRICPRVSCLVEDSLITGIETIGMIDEGARRCVEAIEIGRLKNGTAVPIH